MTEQTIIDEPDQYFEQLAAGPYSLDGCNIIKQCKEGAETLANFCCRITDEYRYNDGHKVDTHLRIDGRVTTPKTDQSPHGYRELPPITIPAKDFTAMGWSNEKWGMGPVIYPIPNASKEVATAIQLLSKPKRHNIYTHTGWTLINETPHYLTLSGAIGPDGLNPSITVKLPDNLARYSLPAPHPDADDFKNAARLVNIGPRHITWTLLLATIRAAIGGADFAIHLAGRTGTFKSEVTSLFQSFYGTTMDARHLPATWSSTGNALEALSYYTKDAIMSVDDFVPIGSTYAIKALTAKADALIRAQGNGGGRARLTDVSSMQQTYYPRGLILSTGEDIPEGHSMRGRMLILELAPNDITPAQLTKAQEHRPAYSRFLASFIQWLSKNPDFRTTFDSLANHERNALLGTGHTRTPTTIAQLLATLSFLILYARAHNFFDEHTLNQLEIIGRNALLNTANNQVEYLTTSDPVNAFRTAICTLMQTKKYHLKTKTGGIPHDAAKYGWEVQEKAGSVPDYHAPGPRIGWVDLSSEELYLDPNVLDPIRKAANGQLAVTTQTLCKRLVEAGIIKRRDVARKRTTIRIQLEGIQQNVLALDLNQIFADHGDSEQQTA